MVMKEICQALVRLLAGSTEFRTSRFTVNWYWLSYTTKLQS